MINIIQISFEVYEYIRYFKNKKKVSKKIITKVIYKSIYFLIKRLKFNISTQIY